MTCGKEGYGQHPNLRVRAFEGVVETYSICQDAGEGGRHTAEQVEDRVPLADLVYNNLSA